MLVAYEIYMELIMYILSLLEELAENTHHNLLLESFIGNQPDQIQEAFLTNNINQLRNILGDVSNLADRNKVVSILV